MDYEEFNKQLKAAGIPKDTHIHVRMCTSKGEKSDLANPEMSFFKMWISRPYRKYGYGAKNRSILEAGQYIVDNEGNTIEVKKTTYEHGPRPRTHCISKKILKLSQSKKINEMLIERHLRLNQKTRGLMKQEEQNEHTA